MLSFKIIKLLKREAFQHRDTKEQKCPQAQQPSEAHTAQSGPRVQSCIYSADISRIPLSQTGSLYQLQKAQGTKGSSINCTTQHFLID